jgi:AraC-type DNA-binding domain-containing proteins
MAFVEARCCGACTASASLLVNPFFAMIKPEDSFADFGDDLQSSLVMPVEVRPLAFEGEVPRAHEHESPELILNYGEGAGTLVWWCDGGNGQTEMIAPRHCCVIPAGMRHTLEEGTRGLVSLLLGKPTRTARAARGAGVVRVESFGTLTANDALTDHLMAEFGRIHDCVSHCPLREAVAMALGLKLMHAFRRQKKSGETRYQGFGVGERQRVHDYMASHLAQRFCVSEIARHLGMSRTHFTRRFRASFGVSPIQYALRLRVDKALELLRTGDYLVAEAAYAVGFFDQSHFDRHCRKFYGQAPSVLLRV